MIPEGWSGQFRLAETRLAADHSGVARAIEDPAGLRELREEVRELRRVNERRALSPARPSVTAPPRVARPVGARRVRRRRRVAALLAVALVVTVAGSGHVLAGTAADSFRAPSRNQLAGLSTTARIVTIADSQIGYSTSPQQSYCNKFSAYWHAGAAGCPTGELSEEWCADFAAWAWRQAGVHVTYGYAPGDINAGAVSFYEWGIATGHWHPASAGYVAAPGDVAVYGLSLGAEPSAAHVAIVTADSVAQPGPDVFNGDGDRTGFSVVETGTDETRADSGHRNGAMLAGYVSPP